MNNPEYLLAFGVALVVALAVTPGVIWLARSTGAYDAPDARKVHHSMIPRIGGLGIYIAFMAAISASFMLYGGLGEIEQGVWGIVAGGTFIVVLGLIDDYKNLPAKVKLFGQIIAAAIAVCLFDVRIDVITNPFGKMISDNYIYLEYFAIPATIFWIVGITNTVNLIDGLDGLAAGVSTIASVTIFLVALQFGFEPIALLTAALAGAALGFLFYNFNPAKIFMGDTGSMFLGFVLAGISVVGAVKSAAAVALVVPILALGLPILDTTFAIVRRKRAGVPIFRPDRGHIHHRLLDLGFTQRQAVLLMYIISALLGFAAVSLTKVNTITAVIIFTIVVGIILFGAKSIGILRMSKG